MHIPFDVRIRTLGIQQKQENTHHNVLITEKNWKYPEYPYTEMIKRNMVHSNNGKPTKKNKMDV